MERAGPATNFSCTCGLQLGVYPLSSQDSQTLNLTKEFNNLSLNYHGPAGENQRILVKEKIEEIKQKVADYYYDLECKVIAIPNHYVTPKKPTVLGNKGREKQDAQILDKYLEECLHHELVNAARKSNMEALIINSFQSGDCIQQLVKKGKDTRGKDNYADFNQYENKLKNILGIEDVEEEKLKSCINEHLKWRKNPMEFQGPDNWLFKKVLKSQIDRKHFINESKQQLKVVENNQSDFQNIITDSSIQDQCSSSPSPKRKKLSNKIENTFLYKIPDDKLRNFYKYQFYNFSLQEKKTEWDTIMIIPKHDAIINIEVKLGPKDQGDKLKLLENASDQTKQHFSFMQKLFGGMLSKDWVFVSAACVPHLTINEETTNPCVNCQQFILQDVDEVAHWLNQISEHTLVTSDNHDQTEYENLVAELIYHISIKESSRFDKLISDPLTIRRETEKALTGKNEGVLFDSNLPVYMLNHEQIQAVHSTAKFLIIDGYYGTGKTYVLKERAKKCASDNLTDTIFYIDLTTITKSHTLINISPSSVMDEMAKVEFESYPNVRVITIKDLIDEFRSSSIIVNFKKHEEIINSINHFLRDNLCDHLFIDEITIGSCEFPGSVKTICMTIKVDEYSIDESSIKEKKKWLETMKKNYNALCFNLTKNMRNSHSLYKLSETFNSQKSTKPPDNNVIGGHNYYYHNIYDISPVLLTIAAVKKYFSLEPKEGVVVLTSLLIGKSNDSIFDILNKEFSSTRPVEFDFKAYMNKPEGILVINFYEFQGAQARNIIIIDESEWGRTYIRNMILRAMSFAILISRENIPTGNKIGAIEDKNLHEFIYPDKKPIDCHQYHNKNKHDISAITIAILDKYKLLDQDEGIEIVTYQRISKNIMKDANTKEFLSLTEKEREEQIGEKIVLENKELYKELKRNISRKYGKISGRYYDDYFGGDLVNKPRQINYNNINNYSHFSLDPAINNIIIFTDENLDLKHEFAAWGFSALDYSDNETSIDGSQMVRNKCEAQCRDVIWESQPKFAIIVHDGNLETFSQPKEALNLIEDDNLHEYIPVENTNLVMEKEHSTKEEEQVNNLTIH